MIRKHLKRLLHQADVAASALGQEVNALHDFRVALRSLHSWFQTFGKDDKTISVLTRDISRLASATGRGRDLEVFALWVDAQVVSVPASQALNGYVSELHRQREQELQYAIAHIRKQWPALGKRIRHVVRKSDALADPMAHLAQGKLKRRVSRLSSELRNLMAAEESDASARQLHKCRINIKQIRYLLAPCRECDKCCKRSLQDLKQVQDQLGDYHDLCVFTEMLGCSVGQCDGIEVLLVLASQQRRDSFNHLSQQMLTPPMAWLPRLERRLVILAGKQGK